MNVIDKLDNLLNIKDFPLRLSMIIGKDTITPISVNSGLNRLEYYPEWSDKFGIPSLFTNSASEILIKHLFRIHFFYKRLNLNLTESEIKELNLKSIMKFACTKEVSIVLLRDKDIAVLQKDYSQIKAMLGSIAYSGDSK